jgi:hypothetical protein
MGLCPIQLFAVILLNNFHFRGSGLSDVSTHMKINFLLQTPNDVRFNRSWLYTVFFHINLCLDFYIKKDAQRWSCDVKVIICLYLHV